MGFLTIFGSIMLMPLFLGFMGVLVVVFLISSLLRRAGINRAARRYRDTNSTGYSTGSSSQRYQSSQDNRRYRSPNSYDGPSARRTYRSSGTKSSAPGPANEVVEVPLLEVKDVEDSAE